MSVDPKFVVSTTNFENESNKSDGDIIDFFIKNSLDIDSETLEIYSLLQKEYGEILFRNDLDVPKEKLDFYTSMHFEIYNQKADEIFRNLPSSLVLSSGMFGGKTTLSFLLCDKFLSKGKKVEMLIADVMGENYITARSYKGCQKKPAKRFGKLTNYVEIIKELEKSDTDVVFLDEFSFLDVEIVEDLQKMCSKNNKNLILTGLSRSYLGEPLPAFKEDSKILENSNVEQCFSFVTGFCEREPLGTSTVRYVNIFGNWVLDFGLLPLVVSKEKTNVVRYAPAMYEHTAVSILSDKRELLEKILKPSEKKLKRQIQLLKKFELF